MTGKSEQLKTRDTAELVAKVLAGFFALAYASGYLIVSAHLEALGIRNSGVAIVRAKYIWMGFLYLLPLLSLTAMTGLLWISPPKAFDERWIWRFHRKSKTATVYRNRYPYIVFVTTILFGLRMIFFTARWREDTAAWIVLAMLLLLLFQIVHRFELHQTDKLQSLRKDAVAIFGRATTEVKNAVHRHDLMVRCRDRSRDAKEVLAGLYLVPLAGTIYYVASRLWWPWLLQLPAKLTDPPWSDWFQFGAFALTLVCLHMQASTAFQRDSMSDRVATLNDRSRYLREMDEFHQPPAREHPSAGRARWIVRAVMIMVLYFASISGFAHLIYPLIPVERGGGRYASGTVVDICFRPTGSVYQAAPANDRSVEPANFCSEGVVIKYEVVLEQEPDTVYAASVYDPGVGRAPTSSCGLEQWHEGINGPAILALSSADVIGVRDRDTVEHFCGSIDAIGRPPLKPSGTPAVGPK